MLFPYQILVARTIDDRKQNYWTLFGASGPKIIVQTSDGATSVWPQVNKTREDEHENDDLAEPLGKRIKLEKVKDKRPYFTNLVLSIDGEHLVGVTGEDKCIRVFSVGPQGHLTQMSERCMSRRPSSVTITNDNSTILCADKFGDVYALPLLFPAENEDVEHSMVVVSQQTEYIPAATALTVHSGRNRKTLEEQLKQKVKGIVRSKEPMKFKHALLLGHVSMLTDIVHVVVDTRSYIITSDRDEHIRVSRGQPQAHIVEGFCFGHEAFVSRLCLTSSGLLISGGGDNDLFVWDWLNYRLVEKLPLQKAVTATLTSNLHLSTQRIAVSGIWSVPETEIQETCIVVTCEGIPALFIFGVGGSVDNVQTVPLHGNALSVAFLPLVPNKLILVVSVDNVHKASSIAELNIDKHVPRLQCFHRNVDGEWQEDNTAKATLLQFEGQGFHDDADGADAEVAADQACKNGLTRSPTGVKTIQNMLYNIENLRKRPDADE